MDYKKALEQYRLDNKLSQAQMAERLGISQQVYSNIEGGKKKKMDADFVLKYKEVTGINLWDLQDNIVTEPKTTYLQSRRSSKAIHQPTLVPFLPVKAQAGYVRAIDQEMYMDTLEKYALPPGVDAHGAIWRYWEIEGDSMEPVFCSGDVVLTSFVHPMDWENMRNFYTYVIVTTERVLIKRIYCKNPLEWVLISENEEGHPQQLIQVSDIKEVWVYRKTWSTRAAPTRTFEIKV